MCIFKMSQPPVLVVNGACLAQRALERSGDTYGRWERAFFVHEDETRLCACAHV